MFVNRAINKSAGKKYFSIQYALILFAALSLSACSGGGGDSAPTSTTTDPASNAIVLTYPGNLPYSDSITLADATSSVDKLYKITGLTQGQEYTLSLGIDDTARFTAYELSDFTSSLTGCSSTSSCTVTPDSNGNVYIKVSFFSYTSLTTNYTLNMTEVANFDGSPTTPVALASGSTITNTAPVDLSGYYEITGLTAGNSHTVTATTAIGASVTIYVYQDQFTALACESIGYYFSTGSDESCMFTAAGSSIWVRVKGVVEGEFTLSITDNALPSLYNTYTAQGSIGSEVELTLDSYGMNLETNYEASYYHIAGLTPGETYRAFLDWIEGGNVDLYVYTDSAYTSLGCSSTNIELRDEKCLATASASGELWIKVDGSLAHQYLGASYSMGVYKYYPNEGTSAERVQLTYGDSTPLHSGTVDSRSYYQVNGLVAGQSYVVDVTNIANSLTEFTVGGANPVGVFTADCEIPSWELGQASLTCIVEATASGTLTIMAEKESIGGDFIGTSYDLSVTLSAHQSEGDVDAPVSLALGSAQLPYAGSIGGAPSYYAITGLTIDQAYTISMDGMRANYLRIYTGNFIDLACTDSYPDTGTPSQCTVRALSDTLWVKVDDTNVGGSFILDAALAPYQSEGSLVTPVQVPLGADPKQGVTRASMVSVDSSYYQITGLTIGETYAIAVRNIDSSTNHSMFVYDNASAFGGTGYVCSAYNLSTNWGDGYCVASATDTSLWVKVEGDISASGARYDLSAQLQPVTETLALDYSVAGTFPRTGSVDNLTNSTYTISGLLANELYDITLTNTTDSAYIPNCSAPCVKQADASGQLVIAVSSSTSLYGAFYTLGISAGNVNEGTSTAPVPLILSNFIYSGQVGAGESYYKVTGLFADTLYEVSQTNLTAKAGLKVYTSSTFATASCNEWYGTTADKLCAGISTAAGELYISVPVGTGVLGANFNLNVVQGLGQEGGIGAEVALAYGTADLPHAGTVDKTSSYYEITGLAGGTDYYIAISNPSDLVWLSVFEDAAYITQTCSSSTSGIAAACIARTKNGGTASLFVRVSGSSTLVGAEYTVDVLTPAVVEGSESTPVVLDYAAVSLSPYNGQVAAATTVDTYSYYRLDNLTASNSYTLSMLTQQDYANMHIYTSAADLASGTTACNALNASVGDPQVCTVTSSGASLWIKIGYTAYNNVDGTYFTLSASTP